MSVVNEHPDVNVRKLYAGQVATHVGLPGERPRVKMAETGTRSGRRRDPATAPHRHPRTPSSSPSSLLLQHWDAIAPWLVEALFHDEVCTGARSCVADTSGVRSGQGARDRRPRGP